MLTPFQANFWSLPQAVQVVLHARLNVYAESVEDLGFLQHFFGVLTVVTYKIYFSQHYDFPYNIYKSVANINSKQHELLMDWDKEKPWIQILW